MAETLYPQRELQLAHLRILVQYRKGAGDGGPAIRVFAPIEEKERQILRIDCFEENPHYHLDPTDRDKVVLLHTKGREAAIRWTLHTFQNGLTDLFEQAGYPDLARDLNREAIVGGLAELELAIKEVLREGSRPL